MVSVSGYHTRPRSSLLRKKGDAFSRAFPAPASCLILNNWDGSAWVLFMAGYYSNGPLLVQCHKYKRFHVMTQSGHTNYFQDYLKHVLFIYAQNYHNIIHFIINPGL